MPPAGVKKGTKRARQYEHIKDSLKEQGRSEDTAEEIAARTVNKERARHGESKTALEDLDARIRSPRASAAACARARGARRAARATSSTPRPSTRASRAARSMNKAQLERAVGR